MDEIDEIWAIYRRNLGQNNRWNINLSLKNNFSRWIKNWEQSGRWIAILPLESHLGRRINTGVIWAVKSCCMKEGKYFQKIGNLFPIFCKNRRYISPSRYIVIISPIFWRFLRKYLPSDFSPLNIVSTPPDTRYIADISRHFPPCSHEVVNTDHPPMHYCPNQISSTREGYALAWHLLCESQEEWTTSIIHLCIRQSHKA